MKRLHIVEFLRGLAALSVAMFHFCGQFDSSFSTLVSTYGWLGVDIFFVLSGVVIPLSLARSDYTVSAFPLFLAKRIVRLEPPYIASIAIVIVLAYVSNFTPGFLGRPPDYSLSQLCAHLFYLIPLTEFTWVNPVYWSLAYEFCFYLSVGLLFPLIGRRSVLWVLLIGVAIELVVWRSYGSFDVRIWEFVVGVLLMRSMENDRHSANYASLCLACLAVVLLDEPRTAIVVLGTVAAILVFRDARFSPRWLYLGALSYSLYLTHVPLGGRVINLGKRLGAGSMIEVGTIVAALVVSLAAAALMHRYIEGPALAASRRIRYGADIPDQKHLRRSGRAEGL